MSMYPGIENNPEKNHYDRSTWMKISTDDRCLSPTSDWLVKTTDELYVRGLTHQWLTTDWLFNTDWSPRITARRPLHSSPAPGWSSLSIAAPCGHRSFPAVSNGQRWSASGPVFMCRLINIEEGRGWRSERRERANTWGTGTLVPIITTMKFAYTVGAAAWHFVQREHKEMNIH